MKTTTFFTLTLALCLTACSKQEPAEPEQATSDEAVVEEAAAEMPEIRQATINHMHMHAEQLDNLMFALADGDLEGAMTPAYWLSRHETVDGLPEDLQIFVINMREAAFAVEEAPNLEAARAAAEELSAECQACHDAAGVSGMDGTG
jgi:cytochrome c556